MGFLGAIRNRRPKARLGDDFSIERSDNSPNGGYCNEQLAEMIYANKSPWLRANGEHLLGAGLGATIAHEMARLITIEAKFDIDDKVLSEWFNRQIAPALRTECEKGWALGGLIFHPYLRNAELELDKHDVCVAANGIVNVGFIYPSQFKITAFDDARRICGVRFYSTIRQDNKYFTLIEEQKFDGSTLSLEITNKVFCSNLMPHSFETFQGSYREIPLDGVECWRDLIPYVVFKNVRGPLIGYFRPAVVNNTNVYSPDGISALVRAAETIKRADCVYNALDWEIGASLARLYIDETAILDRNERKFAKYLVKTQGNNDTQMFEKFSPTIRDNSYLNVYNSYLRQIEDIVGLARGTFSNVDVQARTATEIMMAKQRTYVTVADNQKALKYALEELFYAVSVWINPKNALNIMDFSNWINFGDGILKDEV